MRGEIFGEMSERGHHRKGREAAQGAKRAIGHHLAEIREQRDCTRVAFGKELGRHQQIQKFIFDSACEIQSARMLTLHAAKKIDEGDEARVEIGLIKVMGAKMLHNVIDRAIQVHGALGVTEDTPLEGMYRRARFARIYDGPDEVHVMSTARRILRSYQVGDGWDFGLR